MQFIDLQAQQKVLKPQIDKRIQKILAHGKYILGPEVEELEQRLAEYIGVKHCISCANGTDALQLALMAKNIGPGDIVFTTDFSFFATAEVIKLVGATPWFVDVDLQSYNLCPKALESAIKDCNNQHPNKAKAVISVDIFGLPANYPQIERICREQNILLIEDAAQSFGASLNGVKCGAFGNIACTSFFPAKPLGCYGDGGAIFTNDDDTAETLQSLRVHGKGENKYDNIMVGMNSRLDTMQAGILLEKLQILDEERERRCENAGYFNLKLAESYHTPTLQNNIQPAYAQYTLRAKQLPRYAVLNNLKKQGIPHAIYYERPLSQQQAMRGCLKSKTSNAVQICQQVFSIPCHAYLSEKELGSIVEALTT
ncbi:DegT/DnrJ/EryC1/StrS family aminotransferase [Planctobacterium marinum]|uniref:DegT/DnrJ/EryC1/StrS family aminotransferase n=1 Tax=Planctobacterium marinum TaxID=1631968 RepID=UPI001E41D403|nr:DegT/DnrJ/EryC1/StrS family aminotransferase [Planctobacterium marinum]MCC2606217.1 DegT/DnrJ/EryC1/StrS family aminotransferase [Planctobacterium marinum]